MYEISKRPVPVFGTGMLYVATRASTLATFDEVTTEPAMVSPPETVVLSISTSTMRGGASGDASGTAIVGLGEGLDAGIEADAGAALGAGVAAGLGDGDGGGVLAAATGTLVDEAVVAVESRSPEVEQAESALKTSSAGTRNRIGPVVFSIGCVEPAPDGTRGR